jgi:ribosomal protein S18 acetylase RimI-like enzyme
MPDTVIRSAVFTDQHALSRMLRENRHHHHLDWREPISLIGSDPFLVLDRQGKLISALGCPPDPPGMAWLRLFAVQEGENKKDAWEVLWNAACISLPPKTTVAAICLLEWIVPLLGSSGFSCQQEVVMLERNSENFFDHDRTTSSVSFRPMLTHDLGCVAEVDAAAFPFLWQITADDLQRAHAQAFLASVAEHQGRVIGYQISTRSSIGVHLARLAVHPDTQGTGVGQDLVKDLILQSEKRGIQRCTVNTQSDNSGSLLLYKKLGFMETGERYPVYLYETPAGILNTG